MTWSEKVSKLKKGKVSRDGRHWTTQRMQERMPMMDIRMEAQNSQQKSVPDLNVLTVAFLALKKMVFLKKKKFPPKKEKKITFF